MQGPDADADIERGAGDVERQRGQFEFDLYAGMLITELGHQRRDVCAPEPDTGVHADAADEFAVLGERVFEFGEPRPLEWCKNAPDRVTLRMAL